MWAAPAPAPRPVGPVPTTWQRLGARTLDGLVAIVLFLLPIAVISDDRVLARLFVGLALITAYEALFTVFTGATPGKVIAGTRVVALDVGRVDAGDACKRGLLVAIASLLLATGPLVLFVGLFAGSAVLGLGLVLGTLAVGVVVSVFGSPLRRSFIDRLCGTFVVVRTTTMVSTDDLDPLADTVKPPIDTRWGALASFDQRRRARAARLDDAPFLVIALLAVVFATSVPNLSSWVVALLGVVWEVVFVLDETWRISRRGGTSGHHRLGLAVVDWETGEAPSPRRALVRAVLVSLPMYVLPLGGVVALIELGDHPMALVALVIDLALLVGFVLWVRINPGRGLHDLAAHTVVVELPAADLERRR